MSNVYNAIMTPSRAEGGFFNAMAIRRQKEMDEYDMGRQNMMDQRGERDYLDQQKEKAFQDAAMIIAGGGTEQEAIGYLSQFSQQNGLPPVDARVGSLLRGYAAKIGQGDARYGLDPVTITETLPDGTTREVDAQLSSSGGYRPIGAKVLPNLVPQKLGDRTVWVDRRTGVPVSEMPVGVSPDQDPALKGQQAAAVEAAEIAAIPARTGAEIESAAAVGAAERQQAAAIDLPKAEDKAEYAMAVLDGLANHPGLEYLVGGYSLAPIIPGSSQADADAYMRQIEGQAFLEAFQTLKGGGQITQIEGEKATQAIIRLSRKQSKESFLAALKELRGILEKGMGRARQSAGQATEQKPEADIESLVNKYAPR